MSIAEKRWQMANDLVVVLDEETEAKKKEPEKQNPPKKEPAPKKEPEKQNPPKKESAPKRGPEKQKPQKKDQPKAEKDEDPMKVEMARIRAMLEKVCVTHSETLEHHSAAISEFDGEINDLNYRVSRLERKVSRGEKKQTNAAPVRETPKEKVDAKGVNINTDEYGTEIQVKMGLSYLRYEGKGIFTAAFKAIE